MARHRILDAVKQHAVGVEDSLVYNVCAESRSDNSLENGRKLTTAHTLRGLTYDAHVIPGSVVL